MRSRPLAAAIALALSSSAGAASGEAQIIGIPGLGGSPVSVTLRSLSDDGNVAVGETGYWSSRRAVRWRGCTLETLEGLPEDEVSAAYAVSADGAVVVGELGDPSQAFVWREGVGPTLLPPPPEAGAGAASVATDVSADGSVVVGWTGSDPVAWSGGAVTLPWPFASSGQAGAISRDGRVIVGGRQTGLASLVVWEDGAVRYQSEQGVARDVSADGTTYVGDDGGLPAIWRDDVSEALGPYHGDAEAMTPDASTAVGWMTDPDDPRPSVAFLWDAARGLRELRPWLEAEYGLDLSLWDLEQARAVSGDGSTIAGKSNGPVTTAYDSWIVYLDGVRCPQLQRRADPNVEALLPPYEALNRSGFYDRLVVHDDGSVHVASGSDYSPGPLQVRSDGSLAQIDDYRLAQASIVGDGSGGIFAVGFGLLHIDAAGNVEVVDPNVYSWTYRLALDGEGHVVSPWEVYRDGTTEPLFDPVRADDAGFFPNDVAVAPDGTIYSAGGRLVVRANFGGPLDVVFDSALVQGLPLLQILRIEIDAQGNLYALSLWPEPLVVRIGPDGRAVVLLDSSGDGRGHPFEAPRTAFAVSDAGDVFVGDGANVFWIQPGGYVVRVLGPDTFPIDRVDDLAPGPDGTLYFLAHSGLYRLHLVPHCRDGFDDDGDGLVDYPDDPGCLAADSWVEAPQCDNDLDDDGGGDVDWDGGATGAPPDPECLDRPWRDRESRGCGLGFAGSPAMVGLALVLRRHRRRTGTTS